MVSNAHGLTISTGRLVQHLVTNQSMILLFLKHFCTSAHLKCIYISVNVHQLSYSPVDRCFETTELMKLKL